jgi:hypothetical protein
MAQGSTFVRKRGSLGFMPWATVILEGEPWVIEEVINWAGVLAVQFRRNSHLYSPKTSIQFAAAICAGQEEL